MKLRFAIFAVVAVVAVSVSLWFSDLMGGGLSFVLIIPMLIAYGPAILLPRKAAIGWSILVILAAVVFGSMAYNAGQHCSGDGCIGHSMTVWFIALPAGLIAGLIGLLRFAVKEDKAPADPID
jgi:hypothetical protein